MLNDVVKANVEMLEKLFYEKYKEKLLLKEENNSKEAVVETDDK